MTYQLHSVPLHRVLCLPKYTPIPFIVRLGSQEFHFVVLTLNVVGVNHPDSHTVCVLVHSSPILFLDYILLFISETSRLTPHALGCSLFLNLCSAVVVFLTMVRAYKSRTSSSPFPYLIDPKLCLVRYSNSWWVHQLYKRGKGLLTFRFHVHLTSAQGLSSTSTY